MIEDSRGACQEHLYPSFLELYHGLISFSHPFLMSNLLKVKDTNFLDVLHENVFPRKMSNKDFLIEQVGFVGVHIQTSC